MRGLVNEAYVRSIDAVRNIISRRTIPWQCMAPS
jgi:hypothetical protein